jgi:hypothetical protein
MSYTGIKVLDPDRTSHLVADHVLLHAYWQVIFFWLEAYSNDLSTDFILFTTARPISYAVQYCCEGLVIINSMSKT